MPLIEDIRKSKKQSKRIEEKPEIEIREIEINKTNEAEKIKEPLAEKTNRTKIPLTWINYLIFFIVIALVALFCSFSLLQAKTKILKEIDGLQKEYTGFIESVSNKDLIALSGYIDNFDQKSKNSLVILQSVGQDIYVLNLLYYKNQSSETTKLSDGIRAAHLLTNSYRKLAESNQGQKNKNNSNAYLDQINTLLAQVNISNQKLVKNLNYANFSSQAAKNLLFSNDYNDFPEQEKENFENLKKLSEISVIFFDYLDDLPKNIGENLTFAGGRKSYLILFQNNAELRPGGGFIGSFARVDLENGKVTEIVFEKNVYTLDKSYIAAGNKIVPPKELTYICDSWTIRDSNMSADFAESAKKVAWFYQEEIGKKVDGVIAIDTTLFRNLLKDVGPIEMPEYNMTITDENFLRDVQYQVEIGYYKDKSNWSENQPKKILAEMMPKFLGKLFSGSSNQEKIISEILQGIKEKHLLLYFNSEKLEDLVNGINAGGKIQQAKGDYLYISGANIGGFKSSLAMSEKVGQQVVINNDGVIEEKILITRKHSGSYEWPDGINNNFIKIFLPLSVNVKNVNFISGDNNPLSNTEYIEENKFLKGVEFEKSTISFWQNTKPKEESQTEINYERENGVYLNNNSFDYQITIQKQPGIESFQWDLRLVYPEGWKPQNVDNYDSENREIFLRETIKKDSVFRIRFIRSQN